MKTIPELAGWYNVHPTVVNGWKRQLLENTSELFESAKSRGKQDSDTQAQIDELYCQIDQLKVERDCLAERSAQLGLGREKLW